MATPTKWGKEFLANTGTKGTQSDPTITGLADGRFVVAWTDGSGDKSESAVRGQVFNADGSKAGGEFRINKTTDDIQGSPTITELADGRFVVAWADWSKTDGDKSGSAVRAQIFDADGNRSGGEFLVNTTTKKHQLHPTITGLADGRFVVAWTDKSEKSVDPYAYDVRAQVFNTNGSKSGGEFLVNATTDKSQFDPAIASLADGRFVVTWKNLSETVGDAYATDIRAQTFNADGSKSGGELLVSTTTEDSKTDPKTTGLADGRFVVAWIDGPLVALGPPTVRVQVFNADGSKSGGAFVVDTLSDEQPYTAITGLADGRFVVSWTHDFQDVRAQVFHADGTKSGDEFQVNTTPIRAIPYTVEPTITALADGRFVVAWDDWSKTDGDKSGAAVRGQVFDPREAAVDLAGSDRDEQFVGTRFDDILRGGNGSDWLLGEKGKDRLEGDIGKDILEGGKGSDTLEGGERQDKLKGGEGGDQFVFREMGKENADKLVDFKPGKDLIGLDGAVFTGIGDDLGKQQFEIGRKADDGKDRIIYDKDQGKLFWDGDGKGGADQELFAKVAPGLKLGADDFLIA